MGILEGKTILVTGVTMNTSIAYKVAEIAQAEGATGKPFVHTWLHCAHLRVDGEKMSKSLGNFFTLRDLLGKGWAGREIRYVLLAGHYRQPLNFTFDALAAARSALARVDECARLLAEMAAGAGAAATGAAPDWVAELLVAFRAAVEDDLNMAEALAAVHRLVGRANKEAAEGALAPAAAAHALAALGRMDEVLNVLVRPPAEAPAEVETLAAQRADARKRRDWAESDRLRDAIAALGWTVKDAPEGQKLAPK